MLDIKKGCTVPCSDQLHQQYEMTESMIIANMNTGGILPLARDFVAMQAAEVFFILELPASEKDERALRVSDQSPMHKDIYYLDGMTADEANDLLERYGELLVGDGLCRFGFGSHDGEAEWMSDKYNVVTVWSTQIGNYVGLMDRHSVRRTEHLLTAWETFTQDKPGMCKSITVNETRIYDLPELLEPEGLYLAERRDE